MNATQRPQRAFVTVTIMTVLAITTVFMVYAALLASYPGANVTISSMGGSVEYSLTNNVGDFSTAAISQGEGAQWYARLHLISPPSQDATVKFTLQERQGSDWTTTPPTNVTNFITSTITLSPSANYVYACSDGFTIASNYNWGQDTATAAIYRIVIDVNTVP